MKAFRNVYGAENRIRVAGILPEIKVEWTGAALVKDRKDDYKIVRIIVMQVLNWWG